MTWAIPGQQCPGQRTDLAPPSPPSPPLSGCTARDRTTSCPPPSRRLYSPGPYYAAKVAATTPFNALIALVFGCVAYGMFGFRHSALAWVQVHGGGGRGDALSLCMAGIISPPIIAVPWTCPPPSPLPLQRAWRRKTAPPPSLPPLAQSLACTTLFSLISLQWMHFAATATPNQV